MPSRIVMGAVLCFGVAACGSTVGAAPETGDEGPASDLGRETEEGTDERAPAAGADGLDAGAKPDGSTTTEKPDAANDASSDAGPPPTCVPDAACAPANPCRAGTTTCANGVATCTEAAPVPDGTACGAGLSCRAGVCTSGSAVTANGTCTYREVPRVLSCPTGMSCRCYDSPWTKFKDAPSSLDLWLSADTLEVLGGDVPDNAALSSPLPSASIALDANEPRTGAVAPYHATVTGGAEVTVRLSRTVGYVAEKYIKYTSADCGHGGRTLECTFRSP
ncbi:MAG: hypothetical protein KIS78_11870 [Labilithrix sp.]|nr:hypothetical protein [Labilithrix sp.]MCW5833090.1 hypothetical protein [Labilithrix sp.]